MATVTRRVCVGLMVAGLTLIFLSMALAISIGTRAGGIAGVYTSTTPGQGYTDDTYPAKFISDARLTLNVDGTGSLWISYTNVIVHKPGWVDPATLIGTSETVSVSYSVSGSSVTITIHAPGGGNYPLTVTWSGNRLYGSGQYTDLSNTINSWTMDVTMGGGTMGLSGLGGLAGAVGLGGFLAGFGASMLPPPRYMGGSIIPPSKTTLGTPYSMTRSIGSLANQTGTDVTKPLPDVPRMQFGSGPIQFPNVEMGQATDVQPTNIQPTDVLAKRFCPDCGAILTYTAAGWSCPICHRPPPGGLDK